MKFVCFLLLSFAVTSCSSRDVAIDPTWSTPAEDAYTIANMYRSGFGVPQDRELAFKLYKKAAELGNIQAQQELGDIYYFGEETKQSYSKANYWYEKAAKSGNADAQMKLGYAYMNGEGFTVNYGKAKYWLQLADKQDQPGAGYHLGILYFEGKGVSRDNIKAVSFFKKSCDAGSALACEKLKLTGANK